MDKITKSLLETFAAQYEVEKKDKDLLLKDQAIQLKEKDIALLTREGLLQKLENEKLNWRILLASILLIFHHTTDVVVAYWRYYKINIESFSTFNGQQ